MHLLLVLIVWLHTTSNQEIFYAQIAVWQIINWKPKQQLGAHHQAEITQYVKDLGCFMSIFQSWMFHVQGDYCSSTGKMESWSSQNQPLFQLLPRLSWDCVNLSGLLIYLFQISLVLLCPVSSNHNILLLQSLQQMLLPNTISLSYFCSLSSFS